MSAPRRVQVRIHGWILADRELDEPVPGTTLRGLGVRLCSDGDDECEQTGLSGAVRWARFDALNNLVETVVESSGLVVVTQAPGSANTPVPDPGSRFECFGHLHSVGLYEFEDFGLPDVRMDWRVLAVRPVSGDGDDLIVDLEPVESSLRRTGLGRPTAIPDRAGVAEALDDLEAHARRLVGSSASVKRDVVAEGRISVLAIRPGNPGAREIDVIGEQSLVVQVGDGSGRWELAYSVEDLRLARRLIESVVAGRVVERSAVARSRVSVVLADGREVSQSGYDGLLGLLPLPGWRRWGRTTRYQPYGAPDADP